MDTTLVEWTTLPVSEAVPAVPIAGVTEQVGPVVAAGPPAPVAGPATLAAPPDGGWPRLAELVWAGPLVSAMFVGAALEPFVPLLDRVMGIRPPTRR